MRASLNPHHQTCQSRETVLSSPGFTGNLPLGGGWKLRTEIFDEEPRAFRSPPRDSRSFACRALSLASPAVVDDAVGADVEGEESTRS